MGEGKSRINTNEKTIGKLMVIKKKSVLIVDDDPDFRIILETILERQGMETVSCSSLLEATEKLKVSLPDLIILDLKLGNEHGVQFLHQRFGDKSLSQIPVIICSSENSAPLIKSILKFNSVDYLLKPIKQAWLIQKVRKALLNSKELKVEFSNEIVSLEISADAVKVLNSGMTIESNIGFEKDVVVEVGIKEKERSNLFENNEVKNGKRIVFLKTSEKSKYNKFGTFETSLAMAGVTQDEKVRIKLLKAFWRFDE